MKTIRLGAALILGAIMLCSCATDQNRVVRFQQEEQTDVVVHFLDWKSISITRPDTSEGGFLPLYDKAQAEDRLQHLETGRGLAVVTYSYTLGPVQEAEAVDYWTRTFTDLGFERLVFLRARGGRSINGLAVLRVVPLNTRLAQVESASRQLGN
jgi:hypothetical protein